MADVPLAGGIVRGDVDPSGLVGNLFELPDRTLLANLLHQDLAVEALLFGLLLEERICLHHPGIVHHGADVRDGEQWLDTGGTAGNYAYGSGRRDGGDGGVAQADLLLVVDAFLPVGEGASLPGQLRRGLMGFLVDEAHHPFG